MDGDGDSQRRVADDRTPDRPKRWWWPWSKPDKSENGQRGHPDLSMRALFAVSLVGVVTVVILWCLSRIVVFLDEHDAGPQATLAVNFVAAVVLLVLVLCTLAIVFNRLELSDPSRAMGLPEGSVRAVIALLLIMLFFLATMFLFSSSQNRTDATMQRSLQGISAERLSGIPTDEILTLTTSEAMPTLYDVTLTQRPINTPTSNDIAKQLVTLLGTLVTAVAAFYFGANSVAAAHRQSDNDEARARAEAEAKAQAQHDKAVQTGAGAISVGQGEPPAPPMDGSQSGT